MDAPSQLRSQCGLPPLLLFPPEDTTNQQLWDNNAKEKELMDIANERVQWLIGYINRLDENILLSPHADHGAPTIFDIKKVSALLQNSPIQLNKFRDHIISNYACSDDDAKYVQYWKGKIVEGNCSDWDSLFLYPLEEAAADILTTYSADNEALFQSQDIEAYLQYQAAETLRTVQHMTLSSLKDRLQQQQSQLIKMEAIQKDIERKYNTAFEYWDDYCMNVLKVESDTLPLCPLNSHDAAAMNSFVLEIGKCVIGPLREEFNALSERFIKKLTGNNAAEDSAISQAINYYRTFTKFLRQQHSSDEQLETLHHFVTGSDSNICIGQFQSSPDTRVKLISDLQMLEVFLSCRKKEIDGSSSRGFGHVISEAIDLEWAQFSTKQMLSIDDIGRFKQSTNDVLQQILGDSAQARRLRLLSDAVGYHCDQEASSQLKLICQKAANLSLDMTLLDEKSKVMTASITKHTSAIESVKQAVKAMEISVNIISEGLITINKS